MATNDGDGSIALFEPGKSASEVSRVAGITGCPGPISRSLSDTHGANGSVRSFHVLGDSEVGIDGT